MASEPKSEEKKKEEPFHCQHWLALEFIMGNCV